MSDSIAYGTRRIDFSVERRDRETWEISVDPHGEVLVIAPLGTPAEEISARVERRGRWILAQQRYFAQFRPRVTPRQWVSGESHLYLGRQHRLRIGDPIAPIAVRRTRGLLLIDGVDFDDSPTIERTVLAWYRQRARDVFDERLELCLARFGTPTVAPRSVTLRAMASRWASMSAAGRLSLNPLLVRARLDEIDYVITHELAHRLQPHHGPEFWAVLESVMPDHLARKARLEQMLA